MPSKQSKQKQARKPAATRTRVTSSPKAMAIAPVASTTVMTGTSPIFRGRTANSTRITNREFVTDVFTTAPQTVWEPQSIALNPGIGTSFPWLSSVANQWELYRFHRLTIHWVPTCPTTQSGAFCLCVDYDALDTPPQDKQTMLSYGDARASAGWNAFSLPLSPSKLGLGMPQRYTRSGSYAGPLDLKTYDVGTLYYNFPVSGASGTLSVGELWFEYDVELYNPQRRSVPWNVTYKSGAKGATQYLLNTDATTVSGTSPVEVTNDESGRTWLRALQNFQGLLNYGYADGSATSAIDWEWGATHSANSAYTVIGDVQSAVSNLHHSQQLAVKLFAGDILTGYLGNGISTAFSSLMLTLGEYATLIAGILPSQADEDLEVVGALEPESEVRKVGRAGDELTTRVAAASAKLQSRAKLC